MAINESRPPLDEMCSGTRHPIAMLYYYYYIYCTCRIWTFKSTLFLTNNYIEEATASGKAYSLHKARPKRNRFSALLASILARKPGYRKHSIVSDLLEDGLKTTFECEYCDNGKDAVGFNDFTWIRRLVFLCQRCHFD